MNLPLSLAYDSLCKTISKGTYSNLQLKNTLGSANLPERDRAMYKQLYFGVLERLYLLDFYIGKFLKKKPESMDIRLMNILRLGTLRIMIMDTYDSSAVNEAVDMAKKHAPYASGFVNGLLRNISRNKEALLNEPTPPNVRYSVSLPVYTMLRGAYGKEKTNSFLEGAYEKGEICARVNTIKTTPEDLKKRLESEGVDAKIEDDMLILNAHTSIENTPSYKEGLYHLQGRASQNAVKLLNPAPGMTLIDACAAPGSKSFTAAYMMKGIGRITAFDLYQHRVELIKSGAKRLGLSLIEAKVNDASKDFDGMADIIICDMPCSGIGMIQKRPEIRFKDMSEIAGLIALQKKILENMSRHLNKGGRLLYSTCTLNPSENEGVTDAFLEIHTDFEYKNSPTTYMEYGKEGFFTAILGRKDD